MKYLIVFLSFVLTATAGKAGEHQHTIELIQSGNYYFVKADFEGISLPVIFLFDTGTNGFGITKSLKNKLGVEKGDPIKFRLGDLEITNNSFGLWSNLDENDFYLNLIRPHFPAFICGGIIGNYPVISDYYAIIDLEANTLSLAPPLKMDESIQLSRKQGTVTEFKWVNHMIFVEGNINNSYKGYFHFDTGIPTYHFLTLAAAQKAGCPFEHEELEKNNMSTLTAASFQIGELNFGESHFLGQNMDYNVHPFGDYDLPNIIGSLANDNMNNHIIHLDFVHQQFGIER